MRSQSILLLTLALGCGLVASIGISQVMDRNKAPAPVVGETESIYVALKDINYNDVITPQVIKLEEWPTGKVPPGSITKLEEVEGKRCRTKLFAGEAILKAKLIGAGESQGVTQHIPPGFRVVTVRVDAVSGGGLILPGDRVDVLAFLKRNPSDGLADTSAKTVLQDINVFAVDTVTSEELKNDKDQTTIAAKTVSLLVTPQQARVVTLAAELGSIRLVMRAPGEENSSDDSAVTVSEVFGGGLETKSNRREEAQVDNSGKAKTMLDMLNEKRQEQTASQTETAGKWKMVLFEGPTMRQVEFNGGTLIAPSAGATTEPAADTETPDEATSSEPAAAPTPDPPIAPPAQPTAAQNEEEAGG